MHLYLITPASRGSRAGNRTTATRWARLLRDLGHRITLATDYRDEPADGLIALHAWRSATAIHRFRIRHPARPLIVALTGTDIYRFQASEPETTHLSMTAADTLIGLHDRVAEAIPPRYHDKLYVVFQSARAPSAPPAPPRRHFNVCVVGHLREEKDPLRAALAARRLGADSRLRVSHVGKAHTPDWAAAARREMAENPRYRWRGEVSGREVYRLYHRSHLMVLSSIMEGGANVISEAIVAGLPVLASAIPGSLGLLGADYAGYYPPGDTEALAALLQRAERERDWLERLRAQCARLRPRFTPQTERAGLAQALAAAVLAARCRGATDDTLTGAH